MTTDVLDADAVAPQRPVGARLRRFSYAGFAAGLLVLLLAANVAVNPVSWTPRGLAVSLGIAAPLVLAAIAATPAILSGGGGIDLSVGPLMGLVNVLLVRFVITELGVTAPVVVVAIAVLAGAAIGAVNGLLTAVVRLQAVVATLGTYLVLDGVAVWLMPTPGGTVPRWIAELAGPASIVPVAVVLVVWGLITTTPFYDHLMAVGGDARAAFASGVAVTAVRVLAFTIGGAFAGVAGLSLTALLTSADPSVGPPYTLIALAAVALGGISLGGGRGGIAGAVIGALCIFLLQDVLTDFNVTTFAMQTAYGAVLIIAIVLNTTLARRWAHRGRRG